VPIYEYQCRSCGNQIEVLQKMSEDPLVTCEECGADELRKLISKAAFRLKGTGWYETDFKGSNKASQNERAGESKSESKESTSNSESKDSSSSKKEDKSSSGTKSESKAA